MAEDETAEVAIQRLMGEMRETRDEIKVLRDGLKDVLEQNDEFQELQEELKELTLKRKEAKKILEADDDYKKLKAELDEVKFKYKDLQEILSHHLVRFYNETQQTEVTDDSGETYQVVLTAKLGRGQTLA